MPTGTCTFPYTSNSRTKRVKAGVLQGSILGPLLYNIYTNDIPIANNTHLAIYADDTAITSSWNPTQATKYLQAHLDKILEYFQTWKLIINPAKTQAITFSRKKLDLSKQIQINGHKVPWTKTAKYLGVTLDNRFIRTPAIEARITLAQGQSLSNLFLQRASYKLKNVVRAACKKLMIKH